MKEHITYIASAQADGQDEAVPGPKVDYRTKSGDLIESVTLVALADCPFCKVRAIVELTPRQRLEQPDDTTHVCHPLLGGCNHGFTDSRTREAPPYDFAPGNAARLREKHATLKAAVVADVARNPDEDVSGHITNALQLLRADGLSSAHGGTITFSVDDIVAIERRLTWALEALAAEARDRREVLTLAGSGRAGVREARLWNGDVVLVKES